MEPAAVLVMALILVYFSHFVIVRQAVVLMHIADAYWEKQSLLDTITIGRTNLKNKVKVMVDYSFSAYIHWYSWFE